MSGIVALAIKDGQVKITTKFENLTTGELSMVSSQLRIIDFKILEQIKRMSNIR